MEEDLFKDTRQSNAKIIATTPTRGAEFPTVKENLFNDPSSPLNLPLPSSFPHLYHLNPLNPLNNTLVAIQQSRQNQQETNYKVKGEKDLTLSSVLSGLSGVNVHRNNNNINSSNDDRIKGGVKSCYK